MNNKSEMILGKIPPIIYGTAWKEEATEQFTLKALKAGFRGIDTANQRRHYVEAAVGSAIEKFLQDGSVSREELFIQTKFTYTNGQDHRIPYDPEATPSDQVRQSFQSSLEHLRTNYIDSYVLHGPSSRNGLTEIDWEVWRTMEEIKKEGSTRYIGVSNIDFEQLTKLFHDAVIKPMFVQNRCYAQRAWDREVREFCRNHGIIYQGFSLLTANPFVLNDTRVSQIAGRVNATPAQVVFRFATQIGILPLTGTTDPLHMEQDLTCEPYLLNQSEVKFIESIAFQN